VMFGSDTLKTVDYIYIYIYIYIDGLTSHDERNVSSKHSVNLEKIERCEKVDVVIYGHHGDHLGVS